MKIDRVIYGSTVPTVQFGNQRPGFEASIEPGDDPVEAYIKLHEMAMKAVGEVVGAKSDWGGLIPDESTRTFTPPMQGPIPIICKDKDPGPLATMAGIQNSKSLEELKSFKLLINNDKQLYDAYCTKLKELTQ